MHLGALLFAAVAEMPTVSSGDLFDRFIAWTR